MKKFLKFSSFRTVSEQERRIPSREPEQVKGIFELGKNLLLLLGFFLVGVTVAGSLSGYVKGNGSFPFFVQATLQSICAFIIPSLILNWILHKENKTLIDLGARPEWRKMLIAFGLAVLGMAALNQIIYWNENMSLPDSWKSVEEQWRHAEEVNGEFYQHLTSGTDLGSLLCGILIVGILTGLGEEFFFRGGMLGLMIKGALGRHWSVWIVAVVFSLMHFQMFGFLPRLLLGAWFGYLYIWSGRIWLPVAAHAFNNSVVVLTAWLCNNKFIPQEADSFGVSASGFPWIAMLSVILFTLALIPARKYIIRNGQEIR